MRKTSALKRHDPTGPKLKNNVANVLSMAVAGWRKGTASGDKLSASLPNVELNALVCKFCNFKISNINLKLQVTSILFTTLLFKI